MTCIHHQIGKLNWAEHVARMGRRELHIGQWWENQKQMNRKKYQDVGGWMQLNWILDK
jgi:hypothetical protein